MVKLALDHESKNPSVDPNQPSPVGADGTQYMDFGGFLSNVASVATGGLSDATGLTKSIANGNLQNPLTNLTSQFTANTPNLTPGTSTDQLTDSYTAAQGGLDQAQGLAGTLSGNAGAGVGTQNYLTQSLMNQANGVGPNPALSELNQATGQNINQTAALLASQRGAGGNVGLLGEQAARQGATTQQGAVGQAATLQAQQQVAAQNQLQGLAANQIGQQQSAVGQLGQAQQNEQNILQNSNSAYNNAVGSAVSNANAINAHTSESNSKGIGSLITGGIGGAGAALGLPLAHGGLVKMDKGGNVLDAEKRSHISKDNFALPGSRYPIHDLPHARNALARVSQYGTPAEKAKVKTAVHKKYPELAKLQKKAEGGEITTPTQGSDVDCKPRPDTGFGAILCRADGGPIVGNPLLQNAAPSDGPKSFVGQWLNSQASGGAAPGMVQLAPVADNSAEMISSLTNAGKAINKYRNRPPGEDTGDDTGDDMPIDAASPDGTGDDLRTAPGFTPMIMGEASGGKIPGKPKVNHDSLKNDVVPADIQGGGKAMLSPGEVVIDLNTLHDKGPIGQMARALAKHLEAKNGKAKR